MVRGIYSAAEGMKTASTRACIYSNNLANVATSGFKRDELSIGTSFAQELKRINDQQNPSRPTVGPLPTGEFDYTFKTSFLSGPASETDNPFDLYIDGNGLFTVQGQNSPLYTRSGNFTINQQGELVTQDGFKVMGEKGPIVLTGKSFSVDEEGNISSEGKIVDKLLINEFNNQDDLIKVGNNFFISKPGSEPQVSRSMIKQGYLEGSNVNTVKEMINLMEVDKAYGANEKTIRAQLDCLTQAVTSVGRVG